MSDPTRDVSGQATPGFEEIVERAMRTCGWLLPRTIEEVRRAEAELRADPIPLPEGLRDPIRILGSRTARAESPPAAEGREERAEVGVTIPEPLAQLAREVRLTSQQMISMLKMRAQIIAHRSNTKKDELDLADWRKFYEAVKEFL
jgi:hypothetical protein